MSLGDGQEDPGPLDETGLGRARGRKLFEGLSFLRSEFTERNIW
jgi:hypothetical protein